MVDLQTAIDELNTGKIEFDYKDDDCCTTEGEVVIHLKRLAELDVADVVEVKHGKWLKKPQRQKVNGSIIHRPCLVCSICERKHFALVSYNYCPNCGAKMDGRSDT